MLPTFVLPIEADSNILAGLADTSAIFPETQPVSRFPPPTPEIMSFLSKIAGRAVVMAAAAVLMSSESQAIGSSFNGVYSSDATSTQVIVSRGRPVSNYSLNNAQEIFQTFKDALSSTSQGGIAIEYSYVESKGKATLITRMYDPSDRELLLTFTIGIEVKVLSSAGNTFKTRTTLSMKANSPLLGGDIPLPNTSFSVTESYAFNSSGPTCEYRIDGILITLSRTVRGTGSGQGNPLVPNNPNWTKSTALNFPVVKPNGLIWCDPPYAGSFQYVIKKGRSERVASLKLPKGFGNRIKVLAKPSNGSSLKLVGTYKSGTKINLLKKSAFRQGAKTVLIRGIKPKVNLKKKAPYPLGVSFTNLSESSAKLKIKAKQISR